MIKLSPDTVTLILGDLSCSGRTANVIQGLTTRPHLRNRVHAVGYALRAGCPWPQGHPPQDLRGSTVYPSAVPRVLVAAAGAGGRMGYNDRFHAVPGTARRE